MRPVVLVPGWRDRPRAMRHLRRYLIEAGWPESAITVVGFRDRFGSNIEHAQEIARVLEPLQAAGPRSIDLVAHSMGGLATRYLLSQFGVGSLLRRVIFLGSPHLGTLAAYLVWGHGAAEMRPGSKFLRAIRDLPPDRPELFALRAPFDVRIIPPAHALLAGAHNMTVLCFGHRHLLRSRRVLEQVRRLLVAD